MSITINGSGTLTGISAGGYPDATVTADDLASNAVTTAKISDANITAAKLDGAQSGSAPIYGARAWVNFDGKAASIGSGRANGNVSSVADNATGQYTVNFSNSFLDNDYAVAQFCRADSGGGMRVCVGRGSTGFATGSIQVEIRNGSNSLEDVEEVCLTFFR